MPLNPPPGVQQITTRITYADPPAAIEFLGRAFGFIERRSKRLVGQGSAIIVAEIAIGDMYVMIGRAGSHGLMSPQETGAPTASLMVYVDDVDDHYQRATAAGAVIVSEPTDQYWGDRRYEARDIEGHAWFFHQHIRDVPQHEIDAFEARFKRPD